VDRVLERVARALAGVVLLAPAGCATLAPCPKTAVVVAQKEERTRMEERRGAPRVTATGTIEDRVELVPVREYWVRDRGGGWHRVSDREYAAAAPGQSIDVCR
jgi:hypothetical protein